MWTKHLKKKGRQATVITVLIVLLFVAVWADINAGYRQITLAQLWQILTGHGEAGLTYTLIHLRLPRVLTQSFGRRGPGRVRLCDPGSVKK